MAVAEQAPLMRVSSLAKRFGGNIAVASLDLEITSGRIQGLIGPNGSGKTTVLNLLSGHSTPDAGNIEFRGHDITGLKPHRIARSGVARTFQNLRIFRRLTVFDNVRAAWAAKPSVGRSVVTSQAEEVMERVGLTSSRSRIAGELSLGDQRRLELGRAVARKPELLLLDEPAGGMSPRETETMCELLSDIARNGPTILLVEHKMSLVMKICQFITVLNFGRKISEGTPETVSADAAVIEAYLGTEALHA